MRKSSKNRNINARFVKALTAAERRDAPPPIADVAITYRRRLRFNASSAFDGTITYQNLLDSILVAATATQGYQLFEVVRIAEVEVWHCPMASSVSTVIVEFDGQNTGLIGDSKIHQDTSMGIHPAHVRARPGKMSQARLFQASGASTAFRLVAPSGSVVDVTVELRGEYNAATTVATALVGATAGAVYRRGLDGQAIASTVLPPAVPAAWSR
jgi:hypothetical protein